MTWEAPGPGAVGRLDGQTVRTAVPSPATLPVHPPIRLTRCVIAPPALSVSLVPAAPCSGSHPARAAPRPSAAAAVAPGNGSSARGFGTPSPPAGAYACRAALGAAPSETAGARRG